MLILSDWVPLSIVRNSMSTCRREATNTTQHNTTQHNTTQHNTTQHNTTQHNTTQHNTTQHNTAQHNTTQHNAADAKQRNATQRTHTNTNTPGHATPRHAPQPQPHPHPTGWFRTLNHPWVLSSQTWREAAVGTAYTTCTPIQPSPIRTSYTPAALMQRLKIGLECHPSLHPLYGCPQPRVPHNAPLDQSSQCAQPPSHPPTSAPPRYQSGSEQDSASPDAVQIRHTRRRSGNSHGSAKREQALAEARGGGAKPSAVHRRNAQQTRA